jgi:type VI secretion system secreted protein Hcp
MTMASVDYFLKLDGIQGEAGDFKHKGEIEIESFSFAEIQPTSQAQGGGGGVGKVRMGNFNFVIAANKASPRLMVACATGQHIKEATLTCRKSGTEQQEFMKFSLKDVLVSAYQVNGGAGAVVPVEQFSLDFGKIEYEYREQKADGSLGGSIKGGYDLKANKEL